jgi:hypothetical protein
LMPCRVAAFSSSTPAKRSSASSTATIIFPPVAPSVLAIINAAIRSRRLGSASWPLCSPTKCAETETGRQRLDEFALARSRRPVDQNIRGLGNTSPRWVTIARRDRAIRQMREIVPAQRSRSRLAEQNSPDLRRDESLRRKYRAHEVCDLEVVVVILFDQAEPRQKPEKSPRLTRASKMGRSSRKSNGSEPYSCLLSAPTRLRTC